MSVTDAVKPYREPSIILMSMISVITFNKSEHYYSVSSTKTTVISKFLIFLYSNPPHPTIEGELLGALQKLDLVTEAETMKVQSINFQRAARTDKGVSAIRQVINLKLPIGELTAVN